MRGDYAHGWPTHEARWDGSSELGGNRPPCRRRPGEANRSPARRCWCGANRAWAIVLQFCRYIPMLAERVHREGGRLIWNSFPQMGALLARSLGDHVDELLGRWRRRIAAAVRLRDPAAQPAVDIRHARGNDSRVDALFARGRAARESWQAAAGRRNAAQSRADMDRQPRPSAQSVPACRLGALCSSFRRHAGRGVLFTATGRERGRCGGAAPACR